MHASPPRMRRPGDLWRRVATATAGAALVALAGAAQAPQPAASPAAAASAAPAATTADVQPASSAIVVVARVDTVIHPAAAELVRRAIATAERDGAVAVVLELDTPGGLMTSTRAITRSMLGSRVPVIAWVGPQGAQAASAGFFILMAADVAAMAPGTNTGAAHPVGGDGEDIGGTMGKKVEQDAAAQMRSLAVRHGRNAPLAESAVLESRSFTADEALQGKLVEVVAPSLDALLRQLDGREVGRAEGSPMRVATAGAEIRQIEMGPVERFLAAIAHPNIAYLLLLLGFIGLWAELTTPGAVLPGTAGAICLLLGFYGLSVLPLNYTGVALILLAMVLFLAEIKVTSYGLLTVAGTLSLVLGSLMLFDTPESALRVSRWLIAGVAASIVVTAVFLMTLVVRTHRSKVTTGAEGLVGERGTARSALAPGGRVFVHGELWTAVAEAPVAAGEEIEVVGMDGMTLRVRRAAPEASLAAPAAAHSTGG